METLRILHTNDLHSHFEHFPKIRRYLHYVQKNADADQVFTFDAGDFMDRSHPLSDATEGQVNIRLMNDFNYDAITIGNNEGLSNPHQVLEHLFDHADFPVVLANLREEDESMPKWAKSHLFLTSKKGTRIALVGLTAAYPMTYGPNHWSIKMLGETMDSVMQEIAGQYDLLILITHTGVRMDKWLAKHYPQIDLIVGGHSHTLLAKGLQEGHTWITQTGKWGNYVGDITLHLDDAHHLLDVKPTTIATASLPEEPGDQQEIDALYNKGKELLERSAVAYLPEKYNNDVEAAISVSLDAIADFAGTDLAMLSTGLFLSPFKSGIINKFDLQHALPHPMHVVRTSLQGRDLWRLCMEVEKNRHFLSHFNLIGMSFRGKIFGQVHYKGIKVDMMTRNVYVQGKLLNPNAEYQIAVLDHYVLIPFFPTLSIVGENEFLFPQFLREVVGSYLSKHYPLKESDVFEEEKQEQQ